MKPRELPQSAIPQLAALQWPGGLPDHRPAPPSTTWFFPGQEPRVFVRSPGFDTPTECWSWLFQQGVAHHDGRVEKGPDGQWRGSGEVGR